MFTRIVIPVMLMLFPACGFCSAFDWQWDFRHTDFFGTASTAFDGYDPLDALLPTNWTGYHAAVYHQQGVDAWTGHTGFYVKDLRAPLDMVPGSSKTWRIYVWGEIDYFPPHDMMGINWYGNDVSPDALDRIEFRLIYVRSAVDALDNGVNTVGSYKILNDYADGGTWGNFPACRTDNGLDGYIFDFTATVIPEPSSLIALGAGVASLAGMARRRRRCQPRGSILARTTSG